MDEPPAHIKAKTFPFVEFHGMVCVWFDAEGRPPAYALPEVKAIASGDMRRCGSWEADRPIYMVRSYMVKERSRSAPGGVTACVVLVECVNVFIRGPVMCKVS